jgi:predicted nucleotide-binding protein
MEIFIGCSSGSKPTMRTIAAWIEDKNFIPLPWDTPGLFAPGDSTFQSLIKISKRKQMRGAVIIFNEDDKVWHRGAVAKQPRDNVLIEYGLFVGTLGPHRAIICKYGSPKAASDILGINYIDVSPSRQNKARIALDNWLDSL